MGAGSVSASIARKALLGERGAALAAGVNDELGAAAGGDRDVTGYPLAEVIDRYRS